MKRTLRFVVVLLTLLTLMSVAQVAFTGACATEMMNPFNCPD